MATKKKAVSKKTAGKTSIGKKPKGKFASKVVSMTKEDKAAHSAAMRSAIKKPKSKRHLASQYVNFDKMGRFVSYKKNTPKGYTYLPGGRYLSKTANLRLIPKYASQEQKDFIRKNRKAANQAIEAASRAGAFRDFGIGSSGAADFDLARGGKKFSDKMKDYFHGQHAGMHTRRYQTGFGPAGRRQRAQWSFAFGQDGHVR